MLMTKLVIKWSLKFILSLCTLRFCRWQVDSLLWYK